MLHAERGLFELQRGRLLLVASGSSGGADLPSPSSNGSTPPRRDPAPAPGSGSAVLVAPVEGLTPRRLEALRRLGCGPARLVVTHHRGRAMGLGVRRPTSVALPDDLGPAGILRLATSHGKRGPGMAPETLDPRPATLPEGAGLALARLGRLLPAVVTAPARPDLHAGLREEVASGRILGVTPEAIHTLEARTSVEVVAVSEAPVPLEETEDAHFVLFRETPSLLEHVAILIGDRAGWPDPVPVRLHSACLTGDLFGSLRCDCGEQLHGSLRYFAESGGGILLYLAQEGRGIGLGNKLRAYTIQQQGLDTVEADGSLGFGPDERRYEAAVSILHHLDVERIQLLTNNPDKVRAVERAGIRVEDRRGIHGTLNHHNLPYMRARAEKAGHWLHGMLGAAGALPEAGASEG